MTIQTKKPMKYEKVLWHIGTELNYTEENNPYGLMMKSIDAENKRITFRFTYDYRTNNISIPVEKIDEIIEKTDGLNKCDNDINIAAPICYINADDNLLSEILAQVFAFGFVNISAEDGLSFKNLVLRYRTKESSGYTKYGLYYEDDNICILLDILSGSDIKSQYSYFRKEFSKNISQIPGCKEKCKKYSFETLGWLDESNDKDCSQLHNCFLYKVYNDHSVLMTLKDELDKRMHLLRFDNFNSLYDMFKLESVAGVNNYSMYKTWNNYEYWSIHSGDGGTTNTTKSVWNMVHKLTQCVEAVCGIII